MRFLRFKWLGMSAILVAATIAGCGSEPADEGGHAGDEPGENMKTEGHGASGLAENLKGLNPGDLALVKAQKTCPVSDEDLGSMGVPVKVSAKGKTVFLCCEGCRKKFEREPEKYLAKLETGSK
ncbi:MAG: hypothetical protein ACYSX0_06785 [Planctomycetota bacterium]|jgi:YHS domain-containing protein